MRKGGQTDGPKKRRLYSAFGEHKKAQNPKTRISFCSIQSVNTLMFLEVGTRHKSHLIQELEVISEKITSTLGLSY